LYGRHRSPKLSSCLKGGKKRSFQPDSVEANLVVFLGSFLALPSRQPRYEFWNRMMVEHDVGSTATKTPKKKKIFFARSLGKVAYGSQ
jgi:hypothetical protein